MKDDNKKEQHQWNGKPVASKEDEHHLNVAAAVREFGSKESRGQAEAGAYDDYIRERHIEGAAHHLSGLKSAHAAGNMKEAARHHEMYIKHLRGAKLPEDGPIHPDVAAKAKEHGGKKVYKFKAHSSDAFVPSESATDEVKKNLHERLGLVYEAACAILALQKGDVIEFKPKTDSGDHASPPLSTPSAPPSVASLQPKIDRKKFMDKAKERISQGEPEFFGKEIGGSANPNDRTYDYSHLLEEPMRFQGYQLKVRHQKNTDMLGRSRKGSDMVYGELYHNGQYAGGATGSVQISRPTSPEWGMSGHDKQHRGTSRERSLMAAVKAHGDWAGYHRAVDHVNGTRDLFHDEH